MSIIQRFQDWNEDRADRSLWKNARSWDNLCSLMARWCEGKIEWCPTHDARESETEDIAPALAALNRAGFLTSRSKPGMGPTDLPDTDPRYPGTLSQRAAVEGFAPAAVVRRLEEAVEGTRLVIAVRPLHPGWKGSVLDDVVVAELKCEPQFRMGQHFSTKEIEPVWDVLRDDLYGQILAAYQVFVYDPNYGPHTLLWDRLSNISILERQDA